MNIITPKTLAAAALATASFAGTAQAAEILVTTDIAVATTWTNDNTYNLQDQIYVLPGASLTIEAGTVVASTTGIGGSLAVSKGAQIFVQGSRFRPVIMTSKADVATWTNGSPYTGTWRESANEWGNLTIMGCGYISEDKVGTNVAFPDAGNIAPMEGLVPDFVGDTKVEYGGGDDDDDSGTIRFLSLRYGGRVISLNNELNGLSLGALGRETDVCGIDIMNNVDDGIEIWGGALNLKYLNIWNIGDDSLDIDQGWRGKAQFVNIVQGYSLDSSQGSGVGDNLVETDGAEDSDFQPVTTAVIYNATLVGQPLSGDGLTAWRDNARVQYHNSIFMDCGERVVRFDGDDGDCGSGYGHNGTLSWPATWTTAYTVNSPVNPPMAPLTFADLYQSQTSGNLSQIRDSVFFRNLAGSAYTEATARGVFDAANDNFIIPGFDEADSPIRSVVRGPLVVKGGNPQIQVIGYDPRPQNEALDNVGAAPADGFLKPASYRGAFAPRGRSWLCDWTAADAFGFHTAPCDGQIGPLEGIYNQSKRANNN